MNLNEERNKINEILGLDNLGKIPLKKAVPYQGALRPSNIGEDANSKIDTSWFDYLVKAKKPTTKAVYLGPNARGTDFSPYPDVYKALQTHLPDSFVSWDPEGDDFNNKDVKLDEYPLEILDDLPVVWKHTDEEEGREETIHKGTIGNYSVVYLDDLAVHDNYNFPFIYVTTLNPQIEERSAVEEHGGEIGPEGTVGTNKFNTYEEAIVFLRSQHNNANVRVRDSEFGGATRVIDDNGYQLSKKAVIDIANEIYEYDEEQKLHRRKKR